MAVPPRRRPARQAPAQPAPPPQAPADAGADDELQLQAEPEEQTAPAKRKKRYHPRARLVKDHHGKPTDIGDPYKLLVVAGVVLVLLVLGGVWYLFRSPPPPKAVKADADGPPPSATASGSRDTKSSEPDYTSNAANRAGFFACIDFLQFGWSEGLGWTAAQLGAKYKTDVSIAGVTDPDVRAYYNKILSQINVGLERPMQTRQGFSGADLSKERQAKLDEMGRKLEQIREEIKLLTIKLRRRYGDPPKRPDPPQPPEPEPEHPPEPEEAPIAPPPPLE